MLWSPLFANTPSGHVALVTGTTSGLGKRFATLMNVYNPMPWGRTLHYGKKSKRRQAPQGYLSLFDKEPAGDACKVLVEESYHSYDQACGEHVKMLMSTPRKPGAQFSDVYKGEK